MHFPPRQWPITHRYALDLIGPDDLAGDLTPPGRAPDLPVLWHGQGVAPGVADGVAVFSAEAAVAAREKGLEPVLILPVTVPPDLPGLLAAVAVITEQGGSTSHAAVVTRDLGRVYTTAASTWSLLPAIRRRRAATPR